MTPSQIIHDIAGRPVVDGANEIEGHCRLCAGEARRGMEFDRWQGANFTDQNRVADWSSPWICEACVWTCSWVSPPDRAANAEGVKNANGQKAKGLNLRLFSHLWSDRDGYRSFNKADKPAILAWLRARQRGERWWAVVADTGQKHTIPFARVQGDPRGVVRFEEADVRVGSWSIVDDMVALLTAGATKAEVENGAYSSRAYQLAKDAVIAFERRWSGERGGSWFGLALWLSQRDESAVEARREAEKAAKETKRERERDAKARVGRGRARHDAGRDSGDARAVPRKRGKRDEALGADRSPSESRSDVDFDSGRVVERGDANAPARSSEQLSLFGAPDTGGGGRRARDVAKVGRASRA